MPTAVVAFADLVVGAIITGTAAVVGYQAAAVVLNIGIGLAAIAGLSKLTERLFGEDVPPTPAENFQVTKRSTLEYQRIVYGETLMSGPIVYLNSAGDHNQNLSYAIALAGHEVSSITDMWINDIEIPFANITYVGNNGDVTAGDFFATGESALSFAVHLGSSGQLSDDNLTTKFTEWTSSHRGRGIAYITATCRYVEGTTAVWSAGAPNNIKALVAGKKVYDPRSDSTQSFGTGPHRLASSLTWEYNDNPALCWADYMIDSELGFGEDSSRIDYGYVASAAEACEVTVNNPTGVTPLTDNRWRCSGTLSTGDTYEANIARILSSMNGMANLVNGVWKVRAGVHVTPTLSYDDNVLRGDAKIKLHPDERQRFNTVRGQFIDPARNWKNVAFPEVTAAEFVSRDNNQKLYRDVSLDMTKDVYMAQRLAFGILEQSDLEVTAILPTNFKTLPVEVGGTIQYSNEKMGWTDKEFRVLRYKLSDMGGIDLVVREDAAAAYTVVGTAEYSVANDTGYTTNDPGVPPPSNLTATALLGAIKLTWDDPASRLYEQIEIHAAEDNTRGNAVLIGTTTQSPYIDYLPTTYRKLYYWIRAVSFKGDVSDWEPDSTTTTANTAPLTDSGNHLVIDPDFDLSSAFDVYWSSSVKDGSGGSGASVTFNSGGGANSSNAVDIDPGSGTDGTANNSITAIKRFRINFGWLDVRLRYKITIGSATIDAFYVLAEGFTAESGGTEVISSEVAAPTLVADSAWHTVRIPVPITDADTAQFWELTIGSRDTSVTAGVIRIDSVFVTQVIAPNERFTKVENGDYTFVIGDAGTIVSKTSGGAGETYTIPANSSVAFPIGTVIEVENSGGGTLSIAITTDTLVNTADGATGTRTLADDGIATLRKIAATTWKITGEPLT